MKLAIILTNSIMSLLLMVGAIYHTYLGNLGTGSLFVAMSTIALLVAYGVHCCGGQEWNGNKWP